MRVLFDALGSTEFSGGMRLHSTEIVRTWCELFPSDQIHVLTGQWAKQEFADTSAVVHVWPNENPLMRAVGQLAETARLGMRVQADAVVSLSPVVSPFVGRRLSVCFEHDWRHLRRPEEFGIAQKLYRTLWAMSTKWSDVVVCISEKAQLETKTVNASANTVVIENGRDHARRWGDISPVLDSRLIGGIVTFGHHNNKRPELVIQAISGIVEELPGDMQLVVLGARGEYASELEALAKQCGVSSRVALPGFVNSAEYEAIVRSAACVVMASTDEGFGLPIAEAEYFGIPAIVTRDSGMEEIFADYVLVCDPQPARIGEELLRALGGSHQKREGEGWRWRDAVAELRQVISSKILN